jgi:hypothetical protein
MLIKFEYNLNPYPMKKLVSPIFCLAVLIFIAQVYSCAKQSNTKGNESLNVSKPARLLLDSDSSYVAHLQIDSNHTDTARYFTIYCFITTAHTTTRITVPGNFLISGTLFYGTPIQQSGTVTIFTGHNYGSTSFSTTTNYSLTYTSLAASPSSYDAIPIAIRIDPGPFIP